MCKCLKNIKLKKVWLWIWQYIILNLILKPILPIISFGLAIYFAFIDKNVQMTIFVATGFVFILMFFADSLTKFFESIKIAGMDIKLRNEIKDSLSELRLLAKTNAEAILQLSQIQGRFFQGDLEYDKIKRFEETVKILEVLNVPKQEIEAITEEKWHYWVKIDYYYSLNKKIHNFINHIDNIQLSTDKKEELMKLCLTKKHDDLLRVIDEIRKKNIQFDSDLQISIDDYRYYIENNTHRNFERWVKVCKEGE